MEPIPLPIPEDELSAMLSGTHPCQERDADGRFVRGVYAGMTLSEVQNERRRFNAGSSASLLRRLREAAENG